MPSSRLTSFAIVLTLASTTLATSLTISPYAMADIPLIKQGEASSWLKPLELSVGGSAELGFENTMGGSDKGAVEHRGYADDSNYFANASYQLPDGWKLVGYYELGASLFKAIGWNHHTYKNRGGEDTDTYQRQLYAGISNDKYGTLTYGKQLSAYYQAVGAKTDIWVMDQQGQGSTDGVDDGTYDGSFRAKRLLNYTNNWGPVTLYASYIMPAPNYYLKDFGRYKRKHGAALALNYQINDQLSWGIAYSYTRASIHQTGENTSQKNYNQQLLGTGFSWTPGNWTFAGMVGSYKHFIVGKANNAHDYFDKSAIGWEYYAGYTFPINQPMLKSIQPYVAGDSIHGKTADVGHEFLGVNTSLTDNLSLAIEHQFTHNTGKNDPAATHIRLEYDF